MSIRTASKIECVASPIRDGNYALLDLEDMHKEDIAIHPVDNHGHLVHITIADHDLELVVDAYDLINAAAKAAGIRSWLL